MLRRLCFALMIAGLFSPLFQPSALAAPARYPARSATARIVELVNARRAASGLRPVAVNWALMGEAQRFSAVQARLGYLSHRGVDGTTAGQRFMRVGYRWSFYGENLAAGQETAEQVVAAWMASPSHRAVMLNPLAREIGVGHTYRAGDPSGYIDYWVLELGQSR